MDDWQGKLFVFICFVVVIAIGVGIWMGRPLLHSGAVVDKDHYESYTSFNTHYIYDSKGRISGSYMVPIFHPERWALTISGLLESGKRRVENWDCSESLYYSVEIGDYVQRDDGVITIEEG